jgi:hypothetical protein
LGLIGFLHPFRLCLPLSFWGGVFYYNKQKNHKGEKIMSFTPTSWTGHKRQSDAPKVSNYPNAPFYLLHSPFAWELVQLDDKNWAWLPQFGHLNEIAGVNGIEETAQGADSTITRVKLQEKGINVIDREFGYIARYETKFGGYFYTLKWNRGRI